MKTDIYQSIADNAVVSIIRGVGEEYIGDTVRALYQGGIRLTEITFNTPGAAKMIEWVKSEFGGEMVVGAGTVLDAETARSAILAGADFVLSPSLDIKMIEMCCRYSKIAVPGVLTPTEAVTAWQAGARIVKLFPARTFGPGYIRDIRAPLDQIEIMAVGGIGAANAADYLKAGAMSVGIGSELVNKKTVLAGEYDKITQAAADILKNISSAMKKPQR